MKRYAFIYNPAARDGKSDARIEQLKQLLEEFSSANLFRTQSKEDISHLTQKLASDYDVFVACGGDGTVKKVASSIIHTNKTMGIIPLGTGNDLCKTLKIPADIKKALDLLKQCKSTQIDVGWCNDFIFINTLGLGFDGLTNKFASQMKHLHPQLRYVVAALKASLYQEPFEIEIEDHNGDCSSRELIMATVANGRVEGGAFWIAPDASITDGKMDFLTIKPIYRWLIPILLPLFLIKKSSWIPHVVSTKVVELSLSVESDISIHADGEIVDTQSREFLIDIHPQKLNVICGL